MSGKNRKRSRQNPSKPSNSFSHGLASKTAAEVRADAAAELAEVMIGRAPRTPRILNAAMAAADSILHHHAIQCARHALYVNPRPIALRLGDLLGTLSISIGKDPSDASESNEMDDLSNLTATLAERQRFFATLAAYERKSFSRRRKLIIRLDYEMHEALKSG